MIFGRFIDFGHFPIEIPIEAEIFFKRSLPIELEQKQTVLKALGQKKLDFSHVCLTPPIR